MKIICNGEPVDVSETSVAGVLDELGYGGATVATALNGEFVAAGKRAATPLQQGDSIEIVAPLQGG